MRFLIATLIFFTSLFSYSMERMVHANIHRSAAIGIIGAEDTEWTDFGLGITFPLSRYIGIHAGACGFGIDGDDTYCPVMASEIGIMECYLTRYISPYSIQFFQLGLYRKDSESSLQGFLVVNIGIEFFSTLFIKPYVEGGQIFGIEHMAIRYGGGLRLAL